MPRPAVADAEDAVGGLALDRRAPSVVEVHDVRRGRQVQPGAVRLKRSTTPRRAMELRALLRFPAQLAAEYGLLRPMVGMVLLDGRADAGQGVNEGQGARIETPRLRSAPGPVTRTGTSARELSAQRSLACVPSMPSRSSSPVAQSTMRSPTLSNTAGSLTLASRAPSRRPTAAPNRRDA